MFDDRERNRDCDRFFPRYIIIGPTGPTHPVKSENKKRRLIPSFTIYLIN